MPRHFVLKRCIFTKMILRIEIEVSLLCFFVEFTEMLMSFCLVSKIYNLSNQHRLSLVIFVSIFHMFGSGDIGAEMS